MLLEVLKKYKAGELSEKKALAAIKNLNHYDKFTARFTALGKDFLFDTKRKKKTGLPEVVFGKDKTASQLERIILAQSRSPILVTKIDAEKVDHVKKAWQEKKKIPFPFKYFPAGKLLFTPAEKLVGKKILVLSAGTSDFPIVEEILGSLNFFGFKATNHNDVGVASLERILHLEKEIKQAKIIIVVAGMEAALSAVVSGLTKGLVIAVPTSTGYAGHFAGLTALLGMLGGCSPGVGVVNIDNGFGAAVLAKKIIDCYS